MYGGGARVVSVLTGSFVWRNLDESGGIYERITLFWMKKQADEAGFKGARTVETIDDIHSHKLNGLLTTQ